MAGRTAVSLRLSDHQPASRTSPYQAAVCPAMTDQHAASTARRLSNLRCRLSPHSDARICMFAFTERALVDDSDHILEQADRPAQQPL